jgi:tRNA (adenine57-N1/adenine58-N1)-methyltransferase catalytic subunit
MAKLIIMRLLITKEGRNPFYKDSDVHTEFGFVKKDYIEKAKPGSTVTTNKGVEMTVIDPGFLDLYRRIKRAPQIIPLKDLGAVIAETGLTKKSVVLDAGSGSGATACFLANFVKRVYTCEIRDDFIEVVKHNIQFLGLKNVISKKQDIYDGIPAKNLDLVLLDVPSPWQAIGSVKKGLKIGGYLVSYSPTVPQVSDFVETIRKDGSFAYIKTIEILERDWEFEERKIRPMSQAIGHSGFLTFVRKIA